MDHPSYTPLDLVNRGRAIHRFHEDEHDRILAYQSSRCVPSREAAWDRLCRGMHDLGKHCHALGSCNGLQHLGELDFNERRPRFDRARSNNTVQMLSRYKFTAAMENTLGQEGYITEKLTNPLLAGTVPIYVGPRSAAEVFSNNSFIHLTSWSQVSKGVQRLNELLQDPEAYQAMVSKPAVTKESLRQFFSWHPAVWKDVGDSLRQDIVNRTLRLCFDP